MSTPVTKPSASIAILWGSDNAMNAPTGAIIETLTITPKNAAPIDIEGNLGFSAVLVGLNDGFDAKATCLFDSNKAYPQMGDNVTLVGCRTNGTSGTNNFNCTFWSWGWTRSRKKETMIELSFTHRPDING